MSPRAKRWILHFLRIAVTAVAVIVVVRMIRWQDYWLVDGKSYDLDKIKRVYHFSGPGQNVVWADGHESFHSSAARREGFLSLFDHTNKPLFFAMMAALLVPFFLLSLRWWLLLRGHGFRPRLGQVFFITYAGAFFNNFLPGSVGGDLTKAILASSGEERKAAVAGTVILDRVIGLAVMIVLGAVCLTPHAAKFWSSGDRRLVYLTYGLLSAMVWGYLIYFSPPVRKLLGRLPFKKTVEELDGVFRAAHEKRLLVSQAAALSFGAQASAILVIYGLARAMGISGVDVWVYFIFEPIIFIVTALPISVGGWGVQEYVYQELFGRYGGMDTNQAIALSVLYKLSLILVSIPGGLLFAMGATRRGSGAPPLK